MRKRANEALTIVELLIALALIAVAFAVLATTQVQTLQVSSDSREASDATEYANRVIEQEVNGLLTPTAFSDALAAGLVTRQVSDGRFNGTVEVAPAGAAYLEAGLVRVAVSMSEPANVSFSRLVSCLDVVPPPSVAVPFPCPE